MEPHDTGWVVTVPVGRESETNPIQAQPASLARVSSRRSVVTPLQKMGRAPITGFLKRQGKPAFHPMHTLL